MPGNADTVESKVKVNAWERTGEVWDACSCCCAKGTVSRFCSWQDFLFKRMNIYAFV